MLNIHQGFLWITTSNTIEEEILAQQRQDKPREDQSGSSVQAFLIAKSLSKLRYNLVSIIVGCDGPIQILASDDW